MHGRTGLDDIGLCEVLLDKSIGRLEWYISLSLGERLKVDWNSDLPMLAFVVEYG